MKKFFKKLAPVLVLAMVVTVATPAAAQAAAKIVEPDIGLPVALEYADWSVNRAVGDYSKIGREVFVCVDKFDVTNAPSGFEKEDGAPLNFEGGLYLWGHKGQSSDRLVVTRWLPDATGRVEISEISAPLHLGQTHNFNINGKVAGSTYQWISSDETVAVVNSRGITTAVGEGSAEIVCVVTFPDGSAATIRGIVGVGSGIKNTAAAPATN